MSTRGMQYIIDNAAAIEVSRAKTIGQLVVRSGRIRSAERASTVPWQLIVTPPTYSKYEDVRDVIEGITILDRSKTFYIDFDNNPGLNYVTEYQGDINQTQQDALRVSTASGFLGQATFNIESVVNFEGATTTSTFDYMRLTNLPSIGAVISTSTMASVTAWSFDSAVSGTYNRAFSTSRTDFLIKTSEYDAWQPNIYVGLSVVVPTYVTGGQTISSITRNYTTLDGVSYTRIVMSAVANSSSDPAALTGEQNIAVTLQKTTTVNSSTYIFKAGDWIQFRTSADPWGQYSNYVADRGLARTVPLDVLRGTGTTVDVPVHRPFVFNGTSTYAVNGRAGCDISIGKYVRIGFVLTKMPSWKLLPGGLVQWTGDFELYEHISG